MKCHLCDAENFVFLDLGRQPMANKYPVSSEADEQFFPVKVYFCPSCKNIQLDTTVSRETMFVDYYYLSSVNKALVEHYEAFARKKLKDCQFVVDVGSNDGISLKPLREMGVKFLGVEPSVNVSRVAVEQGLDTYVGFFNEESVRDIKRDYGKADCITGLSMFSHLQDPHVFIENVKELLTDEGRFIVEVEYNVEILRNLAFERFYLDRIFYFSVTSFSKLFERHGMYVQDAEVTAIHGGSLRITAQKRGYGRRPKRRVATFIQKEKRSLTATKVQSFGFAAKQAVKALKAKLLEYRRKKKRVAAYGAPARLSTITNFGDIGPDLIDFVVDDSSLKQWRFSPGKHIPIVAPIYLEAHRPDVLVVFAFDYFKDIKKTLRQEYTFLFPIPPREVS